MVKASRKKSIIDLAHIVKKMPAKKRELFERFYIIEESIGRMKVPQPMKKWVKERFGSVEKIETQKIVHISNRFTGEGALFNELRASRPFDVTCSDKLNLDREDACHFCNLHECTPHDHFGRIHGKYCATASNIAKYDYFHGLIIFNEHNPLKLKKEWLEDYFKTSEKWFREAEKLDSKAKNRFLMWNCLWKSAASLIHGHMQLTASKVEYGHIRHLREIAQGYTEIFGTDYFEDMYSVYESLGLAKKIGKSRLIFYLTPKKEKELLVLSRAKSFVELSPLLFRLIENYKKLGVQSYNMAIYQINGWWIAHLVDRGELSNKSSDIGAMELFADSVVASDPFKLAREF
jgi:hypothetical protein